MKTDKKDKEVARTHFTFLLSWLYAIDELPPDSQSRVVLAIVHYALEHKEPTFSDHIERMLWAMLKEEIEYGWKKYRAGTRGGAPKGNKNALKEK